MQICATPMTTTRPAAPTAMPLPGSARCRASAVGEKMHKAEEKKEGGEGQGLAGRREGGAAQRAG
jgi:hypothetical protein